MRLSSKATSGSIPAHIGHVRRRHDLWLVWRNKDFNDFCPVGGSADGGFVTFLLTGCDRNLWADATVALDPAPAADMHGERDRPRDRGLDDPN